MSHPELLRPHNRVLRYEFKERMNHWVAAGSFIYLMLTGLAFWSPWLFWIASALGGAELSRMLHPWIGLVFFVSVCYMFALWSRQMNFDSVDAAWWKALPHYIQNEDDKMPPAGRYNAGQKLLFWSFFIGAILLLLLFDWALIVVSSLIGAHLIQSTIVLPPSGSTILFIGLVILGVLVQAASLRRTQA